MGDGKKSEGSGTGFFSRAFLILAALALVVIGANPFYRKYGGVINYLDHISKAFAGSWSRGSHSSNGGSSLKSATAEDSSPDGSSSLLKSIFGSDETEPAPAIKVVPTAKEKPLDKVTESDRNKLDNLVSGL